MQASLILHELGNGFLMYAMQKLNIINASTNWYADDCFPFEFLLQSFFELRASGSSLILFASAIPSPHCFKFMDLEEAIQFLKFSVRSQALIRFVLDHLDEVGAVRIVEPVKFRCVLGLYWAVPKTATGQ